MADWTLKVLKGEDAVRRALTGERVRDWQHLADEAKKVAVYQSPGFVLSWYEVYSQDYEPLLLIAEDRQGHLSAVMPLAIARRGSGGIMFAGAHQCEYAGWLSLPALQEEFPVQCLLSLQDLRLLPGVWSWKWLAPNSDLRWLEHPALRARGIAWRVSTGLTPVWALQAPNRPRFFALNGKNYKRKLRLLEQLGEVQFVPLDADALTDGLLNTFTRLYDIRELTLGRLDAFRADPRKAVFHRLLLERAPTSVRFFVLMAGSMPVAYSYLLADRRRALWSLCPFDQRHASCSPGKLMADLVADTLAAGGLEEFDLTPGGDRFKEEVANLHERVHALQLFSSRLRAATHDAGGWLRRRAKPLALAIGVSPARVQRCRERLRLAARHSPLSLVKASLHLLVGWFWSKHVVFIYRLGRAAWTGGPGADDATLEIHEDSLEDFLLYTGSDRWTTRQALMARAIRRIQQGHHAYTVIADGVLAHYAWFQLNPEIIHDGGFTFRPPGNSGVLYDDYTDPQFRGRGLHKLALDYRIADAFSMGIDQLLCIVDEPNEVSRRNYELAGFRPMTRLCRLRILGRSWRWEAPLTS